MHTHIFCCVPYTGMGDGQAEISRDTCVGTGNAIFKGISRPGKEIKWATELFSKSAWLSFIGSLNKSQIFIFDFFFLFLKRTDRRSSTTHCRAPKLKSDYLFLPFVSQRNRPAQRPQYRDLFQGMLFFFGFFLLLFFGVVVGVFFLLNTSAHSGFGD